MDTLNFDFERYSPRRRRDEQSLAQPNLSDIDVFMLRGRRLQAQAIGEALRRGVARLRRLLLRQPAGVSLRANPPGSG